MAPGIWNTFYSTTKGFRENIDFKVSWKMGWRQVTQSRMMVWDTRVYFIHGKKMLRRSETLSLKWEYQFIRILLIYIINPIGIINLASMIQWNLVLLMGNRYFTFFRMSGGNRGRSTGRVNKPYVEISLLTSWVLCLRNRVILKTVLNRKGSWRVEHCYFAQCDYTQRTTMLYFLKVLLFWDERLG